MSIKGQAVVTMRGLGGFVIPKQSIYAQSTVQYHDLGAMCGFDDGRIFRYVANSTAAAIAAHYMTSGPTVVAHHSGANAVAAVAAVGAKTVSVTIGATALTTNQYANGWLMVNAGTGIGGIYKIRSHGVSAAGSEAVAINLYDPLVLALDATSYITLVSNPFKNVVVFPTTATNRPTGVPLVAISQSTATVTYYSWAQTRGLCSLYMGATYTIGSAFGVDDTAGQGLTKAADGTFVWGTVLHIGAAAEAPSIVHLTID